METLTYVIDRMAHGGQTLGRDRQGRVIFTSFAIPGERVRVAVPDSARRHAHATLLEVLTPSPERRTPRCPHFGVCGGCHFQHIDYPAQLRYKQQVVQDQLQRLAGLKKIPLRPIQANPRPWEYHHSLTLSPASSGSGLGMWSPGQQAVIPLQTCYLVPPDVRALLGELDLELADLRRLTVRQGDDGALLLAFETQEADAPEVETDAPLSIALVMPDGVAATLIGEPETWHTAAERSFRVPAGCFFYPNPGAGLLAQIVQRYAARRPAPRIIEGYSGVGLLTAQLASQAADVVAIEVNEDAVAAAAANLDDCDNLAIYNDWLEDALPALPPAADLMLLDPPAEGLSPDALAAVLAARPARLIYSGSDLATTAHAARALAAGGYSLAEMQPLDMLPQTYHVHTVGLWQLQ